MFSSGPTAIHMASAASIVLAAATNFDYARFLGFPAVFTTILAAFFGGTITRWMSALVVLFLGHTATSLLT